VSEEGEGYKMQCELKKYDCKVLVICYMKEM